MSEEGEQVIGQLEEYEVIEENENHGQIVYTENGTQFYIQVPDNVNSLYVQNNTDYEQFPINDELQRKCVVIVEGDGNDSESSNNFEETNKQANLDEDSVLSDDCRYTGIYNGLHVVCVNDDDNDLEEYTLQEVDEEAEETAKDLQLEQITGRNLITGQKFSLSPYLDKINQRVANSDFLKCDRRNSKPNYKVLKRTPKKKLAGKLLHAAILVDDKESEEQIEVKKPRIIRRERHALDIDLSLIKKGVLRIYECGICGRSFSRQSNLFRHAEIHITENEPIHKCHICGCCYGYASSLTRHIVQNHLHPNSSSED